MPQAAYFYALHRNADGRETPARLYPDKALALSALGAEAGCHLRFVETGKQPSRRLIGLHGSHTLRRFANTSGRPGELLESFLAAEVVVR